MSARELAVRHRAVVLGVVHALLTWLRCRRRRRRRLVEFAVPLEKSTDLSVEARVAKGQVRPKTNNKPKLTVKEKKQKKKEAEQRKK